MALHRFLARLYPAWWRRRYAREFDALIEDARPGPAGALDILKGAALMQLTSSPPSRAFALCIVLGIVAALGASYLMDTKFESQAVIQIGDASTIPENSQAAVDIINSMAQTILSRVSLTTIIRDFSLYQDQQQDKPIEDVIEDMRRDIRISPVTSFTSDRTQSPTAFAVTFAYPDRLAAQRVTQQLVTRFIDENTRSRNGGASPLTLILLDPPSLPKDPLRAGSSRLVVAGLIAGAAAGALLALILSWRRNRRPPPSFKTISLATLAGLAISLVAFYVYPSEYITFSSARMESALDAGPQQILRSVKDRLDQRAEGVLSDAALTNVIRELNLYGGESTAETRASLRKAITYSASTGTVDGQRYSAVAVSFRYADAVVAQSAAERIATLLAAPEAGADVETLRRQPPRRLSPPLRGFTAAGLAGGLLTGILLSLVLYLRRRRRSEPPAEPLLSTEA